MTPKHFTLSALLVAATFFRAHAQDLPLPPLVPLPAAVPAPRVLEMPAPLTLGADFPAGIRIQDFARVVLSDILKEPYVLSSDFLASPAQVGFSAAQLKRSGSEALLRDVLAEHGFALTKKAGYFRIGLEQAEDRPDLRETFVYRLKHRDLAYISSQVAPLFSRSAFMSERSFTTSARSSGTQTGAQSDGARPVDDGVSLYSATTSLVGDVLIMRALPAEIASLKALLEQLDTPVPRVLVRALILETAAGSQEGYSVSAIASLLSGRLGVQITGSAAANQLTFSGGDFTAVASALQGDTSVRVVTAPAIFGETGVSASLSVGNSVPTLGSIQWTSDGQSQQSVSYQDTGVILRVTPRVLEESISLSIEQEISDAIQTETGVQGSPTITKRALRTGLSMRSGDWVILGGLTLDKASRTRDSLPFWRRITLGEMDATSSTDIVVVLYVERL